MQAIHPLSAGDAGGAVADLHAALSILGFGERISRNERFLRRYGEGTAVAVRRLQHDFGVTAGWPRP